MNVAIVAPSPIPFAVGGAEKSWWGLQNYINAETSHRCELIKVPIREGSFNELIDSYKSFSALDLSHFDLIISTKYPAWMVQHPNHVVYVYHCLRGLYDTYQFMGRPLVIENASAPVLEFWHQLDEMDSLEEVFGSLDILREDKAVRPSEFEFPGPLVRKIVHKLDNIAMKRAKRLYSLSKTVAGRDNYFPEGSSVKVLYCPTNLQGLSPGSYEYLFTASRMDSPKRIDMIVRAYIAAQVSVPLKIAGIGPELEKLKAMADGNPSIEFLGFLSDRELELFYQDALAVIFVPELEDYGLITIEAMRCAKPVITFDDSGGVTEFVEHGITGLTSSPTVQGLAENIRKITSDNQLCSRMGEAALKRVSKISWQKTASELLGLPKSRTRKKMTVVTTYPVYPPRGGGQNRIYYLYRELAKTIDIEIVALVHESEPSGRAEIAPGLIEIRVSKSSEHAESEWRIEEKVGIPITDIAMIHLFEKTPDFVKALSLSLKEADVVVSSHPFTFPAVKKYANGIPIIHESHNVEYLLKRQMLPDCDAASKMLDQLKEVERRACADSQLTVVCAVEDAATLGDLYGLDPKKAIVVPNGVDLETVPFTTGKPRLKMKVDLAIGDRIVLFIGSWHQPNIDAVSEIMKFAADLPEFDFVVLGSVGGYFQNQNYPTNVRLMGVVDDEVKAQILAAADVAINPMLTGSGTNLKMLDYMAAGVPVISTKVGARGLRLTDKLVRIAEMNNFCQVIRDVYKERGFQKYRSIDVSRANLHARKAFSWPIISRKYIKTLEEMIQSE